MAFMDMVTAFISIFALLNSRNTVLADDSCFLFHGNSYLMFSLGGAYNNSNSAHFQIDFKTNELNGLLMYAHGSRSNSNDTEALYIRGGHLHYHLFNSGVGGLGRQFGGHYVSTEMVNTNAWITVHVYRAHETVSRTRHSSNSEWKTGIEFEMGGLRSYVDSFERRHIDISNTIYFGGFQHRLSETVGNFTGQMGRIEEHSNGYVFEYPSLNYKSLVDLDVCKITGLN